MSPRQPATAAEPNEAPADETRREALKRFGRYAAAAGPAAVLLLDSRKGRANGDLYDGELPNFKDDLENG